MKIDGVHIEEREQYDHLMKDGNEMMAAGRWELAAERYTASLQEQPLDVDALNYRTQAYLNLKRFEEAEQDATLVLSLDPRKVMALLRRGRARLCMKIPDKEGGRADLRNFLSKTSSQKQAREQARALLESISNTELAGSASSAVMIVEDDGDGGCSWCPVVAGVRENIEHDSTSLWKKGEELRNAKDWAGALDLFNRAVVSNPRNSTCWSSISEVHQEQGNVRQSEEAARRAQHTAVLQGRRQNS